MHVPLQHVQRMGYVLYRSLVEHGYLIVLMLPECCDMAIFVLTTDDRQTDYFTPLRMRTG